MRKLRADALKIVDELCAGLVPEVLTVKHLRFAIDLG
jgi:hypothetical protein